MRQTEAETLARAIGLALGAGDGYAFEATTTWYSGSQGQQYKISVNPRGFSWTSENTQSGLIESFDPRTMTLLSGSEELVLSVERIPFSFPASVKLAFPLSLAIWGRTTDDFVPMGVEEEDEKITILLRHRQDPALFGSALLDEKTGRMLRLALPNRVSLMNWENDSH